MNNPELRLLNEQEVALYLRIAVATLRRWRWAGKELPFVKIGSHVRYDLRDLDAYITAGRRTSTSDPGREEG